jgi:CRISPR/Cas system-associated endonuclease Cas1
VAPLAKDAVPLYVTEPKSMIGTDTNRITMSQRREQLASVRPIGVLPVCAYGHAQVSAQALRTMSERDIDVFHFSCSHWLLRLTSTSRPGSGRPPPDRRAA